jgi:chromosome segregation ATPase
MRDNIQSLNSSELDPDEKREYDDLLLRLAHAADILRDRREAAEKSHRDAQEKAAFMELVAPLQSRLAELIETADRLMENPEGIPSQYAPTADQLRSEVSRAKDLLQGRDPSSDPIAHALQTAITAAENRIPQLDERAHTWEEFVRARDDADSTLDSLRQPLDAVLGKPKRSVDEARQDLENLKTASRNIPVLSEKIKYLQGLSERLNPLESAYADVRFLDVDSEQSEKQYDETMNDINAEIEDEQILTDSANHINNEIDAMLADLRTNPATHEHNSNLEDHQIPALRAQLSSLEDKSAEAAGTRKHVSPGMSRLDELRQKIKDLESALQSAKLEADENDREELVLQLRLTLEQLEKKPISELTPSELNALELNIGKLPEKDAQEIMEKISNMKKTKDEHDSRLADAQKSIGDLDKSVKELEKKPKKKGTSPSIDELREKLQTIEGLLPKAQELANDPILSSSDEDKNKISEISGRLSQLADDTQRELNSKIADQEERQRAETALNRLQDAIDKAQTNLDTIPQTSSSLGDFKQGTITHLAQLAQDIDSVPADFTKQADGLRDRLHKLNKDIDDRISKASENEARERAAEGIINDKRQQLDDILAKYHQQGPQPLDTVEQDSRGLKSIIDEIQKVDPSVIESSPQLARDLNDVKQKAKEQSAIFDQNIQNEKPIRDEQKRISDQIAELRAATSDLPHLDPSQALALAGDLATTARQLKSDADNNSDKVHRPSDIVNHNDLNDHLPSDVLALQQEIDEMQRGLSDKVQYESVAPEIQRISDSLATLPSDLPENINEQQQMLENLSSTKERMDKIMNDIPDTEAGRELAQKTSWDLSRIKDLLKSLGDKLGEKMAALAAFRAARKEAEDQLLAITAETPGI